MTQKAYVYRLNLVTKRHTAQFKLTNHSLEKINTFISSLLPVFVNGEKDGKPSITVQTKSDELLGSLNEVVIVYKYQYPAIQSFYALISRLSESEQFYFIPGRKLTDVQRFILEHELWK